VRAPLGRRLGPLPVLAAVSLGAASIGMHRPPAAEARGLVGALLAGAVATLVLALVAGGDGPDRRRPLVALLALVATAAVSAGGAAVRAALPALAATPELAASGGRRELVGRVAAEPRRVGERWQVVVALERVGERAVRERVALLVDDDPPALGERLSLTASARPLPDGGYGTWLAQQHVVTIVTASGPIEITSARGLAASTERLRAGLRHAAGARSPAAPAGLVVGLVSGDTRLLPADDVEAMRAAGLSHLTAVSGSNVALVLAVALGAAHLLRAPPALRRTVLVVTVGWFALLTRLEPSVLRAGTMAALVVVADARGVAREAVHLLAGALLLLLAVDPFLAGSLGLLLSAAATLGVLVVAPALVARAPARVPRALAALAAVSIGAQVAVAPLLLGAFGEVPLVALPANLVAVPLAGVASALAVAGTALLPLAPALAERVLALAALPAAGILAVARRAALVPVAVRVELLRDPRVLVLGTVALLVVVGRARRRRAGAPSAGTPEAA
jgi:competence protein ComEC